MNLEAFKIVQNLKIHPFMKRMLVGIAVYGAISISNLVCGSTFTLPGTSSGETEKPKGAFFITPFYQFTRFQDLRLTAHTNNYFLWQGESSYKYPADQIQEYNDNFGTAYTSSMSGVKIGYQIAGGLGVSAYAGVNHFYFESWISKEGSQQITTDYPALTLGLAVDYQKKITERLGAMALLSYNYCKTRSVMVDNLSGESVLSTQLQSMYYEMNVALSYRLGKFVPYAGAGFSQLFIHPVTKEQILTEDGHGQPYNNVTEFDSQVRGGAIYAFAGMEYFFNKNLSVYLRAAFPNPVRATYGIRVII
jgi:hypothetical protein